MFGIVAGVGNPIFHLNRVFFGKKTGIPIWGWKEAEDPFELKGKGERHV